MLQQLQVMGAKSFNDTVEGIKYDTTKLLVVLPAPKVVSDARNVAGNDAVYIQFGDSTNFTKHRMHDLPFPLKAELDIEMNSKGYVINSFALPNKPTLAAK